MSTRFTSILLASICSMLGIAAVWAFFTINIFEHPIYWLAAYTAAYWFAMRPVVFFWIDFFYTKLVDEE